MNLPRSTPGSRSGLRGRLALATLLLASVLPLLGGPARAADDPIAVSPLAVRLVRLTPAAIPTRGRVVLAGTVTNGSEETWTAVNVHPFISFSPMTTRDELAAAAASDPAAEVGTRLTGVGQFASIGDLAPGETAAFRIALPVKDLKISGQDGVYWIGVHALGQNAAGRDGLADGRARTFIPLVSGSPHSSVAIVVPVREPVRRDPAGRVLDTTAWSDSLAPAGRLGRLAGFLASAGTHPTTLLIDPAVLEAVSDLAGDNPLLSFGKSEKGAEETPSPTDAVSRSADRLEPADRANAATWLAQVTAAARSHTVLGLGFADPDVAALARRRPTMLDLANLLSTQSFDALDIAAVPAVAPPDGWLDDDSLSAVPPEAMVLVSDHSAPRTRTRWRTADHQDLVFTDEQTATGGPGPTAPGDALAMRQRIVSDAALRTGEPNPLVVELPADWDPGAGWQLADFFNSLDVNWLDLVGLNPSTDLTTPTFGAALGYPAAERKLEINNPNVSAARTLVRTTTVVSKLLRSKNDVAHDLAGIALDAVSYHARRAPATARNQVLATNTAVRQRVGKVQVLGTDFVTLSGGSGTLAVTLVNGLAQPIVVGVRAHASTGGVRIAAVKPVKMAPGQRTVLRLKAKSSSIGVTQVVLTPVTSAGTDVGTPLTFSIRTSQVGKAIWAVLFAGGLLLVVMIVRRIRRGLVEHRWRGRE